MLCCSIRPGEEAQFDLWAADSPATPSTPTSNSLTAEPRFSLHVVDNPNTRHKSGQFAVFIVPQGRLVPVYSFPVYPGIQCKFHIFGLGPSHCLCTSCKHGWDSRLNLEHRHFTLILGLADSWFVYNYCMFSVLARICDQPSELWTKGNNFPHNILMIFTTSCAILTTLAVSSGRSPCQPAMCRLKLPPAIPLTFVLQQDMHGLPLRVSQRRSGGAPFCWPERCIRSDFDRKDSYTRDAPRPRN